MDEAGRRYALGMLDKTIEGAPEGHQADDLISMHIGNGAGQSTMRYLTPLQASLRILHRFDCDAAFFQPRIQRSETGKAQQGLPQPSPCILNVLLNLPLLPARSGVAELRLKQALSNLCRQRKLVCMAGHRCEPSVNLPRLA